jgi:hypothetical protein
MQTAVDSYTAPTTIYTRAEVGRHADDASGYKHIREVLRQLLRRVPACSGRDEAMKSLEEEGLQFLNSHNPRYMTWELHEGGLFFNEISYYNYNEIVMPESVQAIVIGTGQMPELSYVAITPPAHPINAPIETLIRWDLGHDRYCMAVPSEYWRVTDARRYVNARFQE